MEVVELVLAEPAALLIAQRGCDIVLPKHSDAGQDIGKT